MTATEQPVQATNTPWYSRPIDQLRIPHSTKIHLMTRAKMPDGSPLRTWADIWQCIQDAHDIGLGQLQEQVRAQIEDAQAVEGLPEGGAIIGGSCLMGADEAAADELPESEAPAILPMNANGDLSQYDGPTSVGGLACELGLMGEPPAAEEAAPQANQPAEPSAEIAESPSPEGDSLSVGEITAYSVSLTFAINDSHFPPEPSKNPADGGISIWHRVVGSAPGGWVASYMGGAAATGTVTIGELKPSTCYHFVVSAWYGDGKSRPWVGVTATTSGSVVVTEEFLEAAKVEANTPIAAGSAETLFSKADADEAFFRALHEARQLVAQRAVTVAEIKGELKDAQKALEAAELRLYEIIDEHKRPNLFTKKPESAAAEQAPAAAMLEPQSPAEAPTEGPAAQPAASQEPTADPPAPAAPAEPNPDDNLWREFPIERLGKLEINPLPPGVVKLLVEASPKPIETLGDFSDFQKKHGDFWAKEIKGCGPKKRQNIEDAIIGFWVWWAKGGCEKFTAERASAPPTS